MTRFNFLLGCAASVFILQACSGEQDPNDGSQTTDRELCFSAVIENNETASRVTNSQWSKNDCIGVYVISTSTQTAIAENRSFITLSGDGSFYVTSGSLPYPTETADYKAYYPYSETVNDYIYKVDVSDQSNPEKIDLLYSDNLTARAAGSVTGNLQFKHQLARLCLNISSSDGSDFSQLSASVTGVPATAEFNLSTKTFASQGSSTAVEMHREGNCMSALLIPVTKTSGIKVQFSLNGKSKEISLPSTFTSLTSGNDYIVNINITNGGSAVTPETSTYFQRRETPVITDEQLTKYKYVTHFCPNDKNVRNYSMLYDTELKMAYWVAYPLCKYYIGSAERSDEWTYDPELGESTQAYMFKGYGDVAGYDRGHQIPSADRTKDSELNATTFYFSNQTPQISEMNQGIWANLEQKVRSWMSGTDTLFVVTGAMPTTATDQTITYTQDNNRQRVAVPKYYFKAIARKVSGTFYTIGFKIENKKEYSQDGYMDCAMSVADLEKETGFTFFPTIDASAKSTLDTTKWN